MLLVSNKRPFFIVILSPPALAGKKGTKPPKGPIMAYIHLDGGLELFADAVTLTNETTRREIVFQWRGGRQFWKNYEITPKAVHVGPFPYVCLKDENKNLVYILIVDDPRANVARFRVRVSSDYLIKSGCDGFADFDRLKDDLAKLCAVFGVARESIKVTRLDLSLDDLFFKVDEVIQADRADLIRARFRTITTVQNDQGNSITFGRGSGAWQVCFYDKTAQEKDLAKLSHLYERLTESLPDSVLNSFKKLPRITRLEFRFFREILHALNMSNLDAVDLGGLLTFARDNFKILETKSTNQKYEIVSPAYERLFFLQNRVKYQRNRKRPSGQITSRALKCACTVISKHLARSISSDLSWSLVVEQIWQKVRSLCESLPIPTGTPQIPAPSSLFSL